MINRELYLERIRPFIDKDLVKIIVGMRRTGKSTLLDLLKAELRATRGERVHIIEMNFESLSLEPLKEPEALYAWLVDEISKTAERTYLFFDEIQEVRGWERVINSLRVDFDCDIYLTGSNAYLLSEEYATYLAGRYIQFNVYPFNYREILLVDAPGQDAFERLLHDGGMPALYSLDLKDTSMTRYLEDVYNSVVLKDIVKRKKIRDVDLLERIICYTFANIGKTFSAASIRKYLKSENRDVSQDTVLSYLAACVDAHLLVRLNRHDLGSKKILKINEKYYATDHGLRNAVLGKEHDLPDIELLLENIVCIDLLSRGYRLTVGRVGDKEIDFVAESSQDRIYVQVCYLLAAPETVEREFNALAAIPDNFKKFVVSLDEVDFSRAGIKHLNIRDFLAR